MEWKKKIRIIWIVFYAGMAITLGGYLLMKAFPVIGEVIWVIGLAMVLGVAVFYSINK
jgi:uncharacterized membrane protein